MTRNEALRELAQYRDAGEIWLSTKKAGPILGCLPVSLLNAADKKKNLGSLEYFWAGDELRISTMSIIKFVAGGYPLREIFTEGM